MLTEKETTALSKFLSLVLRHQPEIIGITLDNMGWANVDELIEKANSHGNKLDSDTLKYIVETSPKKRFNFNESMDKIRASQGHSIAVELGYAAQEPPELLFHGTSLAAVESILRDGLTKQDRHHVHLSSDHTTAFKVGQRHGKPIVFEVLAGEMHRNQFAFYLSDNQVWLTDHVPAAYLREYLPGTNL